MESTVKLTSQAKLPMELLQHIFSYTSNVVFRPFTDELTNETQWRMWVISQLPNTDPRYRMVCAIPPRLKLYIEPYLYAIANPLPLDRWYYKVVLPNTENDQKQFQLLSISSTDSSGKHYTFWMSLQKECGRKNHPEYNELVELIQTEIK